jgi:hypothetical protein
MFCIIRLRIDDSPLIAEFRKECSLPIWILGFKVLV